MYRKTIERGGEGMCVLAVEVPVSDLTPYLEKAAEKLSREKPIAGWRPGKIDVRTAEQSYGGQALYERALDFVIRDTLPRALRDESIKFIGEPTVTVTMCAPGNPITYTAEVMLFPEVTVGDISKIQLHRNTPVISDDEVEETIDYLKQSRAEESLVARKSKDGDRVDVTLEVFRDSVPLESGGREVSVVLGARGEVWPGMSAHLMNVEKGEVREFTLTMPEPFFIKKLSGKTIMFKAKVRSVLERKVPEVNDRFAQSLGNFSDLASLRKTLRENLIEEKTGEEQKRLERELVQKLVDISTISEIPKNLVLMEEEQMLLEQKRMVEERNLSWSDYLLHLNTTEEDMKKGFEESARFRLKKNFIIAELVRQRSVAVSEEEVDRAFGDMLSKNVGATGTQSYTAERRARVRMHLKAYLFERKLIDQLLSELVN